MEVTEESNLPVHNATVVVAFEHKLERGFGWGSQSKEQRSVTDSNGKCSINGACDGSLGLAVIKEGYYSSSGYRIEFTNAVAGRWQPWKPVFEVALKKQVEPIAMYAKAIGRGRMAKLPQLGQPCAFDLEKGDWVQPAGRGLRADIYMKVESQIVSAREYAARLTISFPNTGDGLQLFPAQPYRGSSLRLPRIAPESGYEAMLTKQITRTNAPSKSDLREDANYFYRIRTVVRDGKVVSGLYGKIYGDFSFTPKGEVTFTYFLNPTENSRNMEFDQSKNLFKNLSSMEQVTVP